MYVQLNNVELVEYLQLNIIGVAFYPKVKVAGHLKIVLKLVFQRIGIRRRAWKLPFYMYFFLSYVLPLWE